MPEKEHVIEPTAKTFVTDWVEIQKSVLDLQREIIEVQEQRDALQRENSAFALALQQSQDELLRQRELHEQALRRQDELHRQRLAEAKQRLLARRQAQAFILRLYAGVVIFTAAIYLLAGFGVINLEDSLLAGLATMTIGEAAALVLIVYRFLFRDSGGNATAEDEG